MDLEMAAGPKRFVQAPRGNVGNWLLARRVDVHQIKHVGAVERALEVVEKIARPGVTVRLKDRDDAASKRGPRGRKCRPNLRRMMRVVVEHDSSPGFTLDFETPVNPPELL